MFTLNLHHSLFIRLHYPQHLDGIWTGPVHIRVTFVTLIEYPEPWFEKFLEVIVRGLPGFSAFLYVSCWQSQLNKCDYTCRTLFLPFSWQSDNMTIWKRIVFNVFYCNNSYIDPVGCDMFAERSSRHQEAHAKKDCHMSHVTCHVSCVMCHVSRVTCHMSIFFNFFYFFTIPLQKKILVLQSASVERFSVSRMRYFSDPWCLPQLLQITQPLLL